MIALVMTPFDMVFFKMMAKTANMTSQATFLDISRDVFVKQRKAGGSWNAVGLAMAATFFRYVLLLTSTHGFMNS